MLDHRFWCGGEFGFDSDIEIEALAYVIQRAFETPQTGINKSRVTVIIKTARRGKRILVGLTDPVARRALYLAQDRCVDLSLEIIRKAELPRAIFPLAQSITSA